ncbi:hypothetical protein [uncultured Bdellovibrio sp.]|uniref:hypothetical protein n=1 Tax=Bdellovibrio sp. HCB-162 TaxID=3394234 RepID=UPI0025D17B4F|nr:hypothetical protein [uncultured Bdellovibrio sp.]
MTFKILARSETSDKSAFDTLFAKTPSLLRTTEEVFGMAPEAWTQALLSRPLPFPCEFWIATENDNVIGRIGANLSPFYKDHGYLGFFEAKDKSTAHSLLEKASSWLRAKGVKAAVGPVNLNTWLPYRFRTDWKDPQVFSWEPNHPRSYSEYFESFGFQNHASYHTNGYTGLKDLFESTKADYEKALQKGFSFRPLIAEQMLQKDIPSLHRITMAAFQKNFLFEPVPLDYFKEFYVPLAKKENLEHAVFAVSPSGEDVGYFFNIIEKDYFVLKTVGIDPVARGNGLSNAMLHHCLITAVPKGLEKTISALVKAGNQSESYGKKQKHLWTHEYTLYKKDL